MTTASPSMPSAGSMPRCPDASMPPASMPSPITSLSPWYGNKRTLAPTIAALLGPHRVYAEPFAGGMAVIQAKPVAAVEVLNDLHDGIINAARAVADPRTRRAVRRRLAALLCAEREFLEAREWLLRAAPPETAPGAAPDVEHAARSLTLWWQGRNGEAGQQDDAASFGVRFTDGPSNARRWLAMQASLRAIGARLANATILCRDGCALLRLLRQRADNPDTAIYLDPPYVDKTKPYRHDFDALQHSALANLAASFRHARIVVSYYDHPLVRLLYPERLWQWVIPDFTPTQRNTVSAARGQRSAAPPPKAEVLLVRNGPPVPASMPRCPDASMPSAQVTP